MAPLSSNVKPHEMGALRWLLIVVVTALLAYFLGYLVAAIGEAPSTWLAPQDPTGRPPRFVALLALLPIAFVGGIAILVKLWRWAARGKQKRTKRGV